MISHARNVRVERLKKNTALVTVNGPLAFNSSKGRLGIVVGAFRVPSKGSLALILSKVPLIVKSESRNRSEFCQKYTYSASILGVLYWKLNLAVADVFKQVQVIGNVLDTVWEISRLLKFSPKRDRLFDKLKNSMSPDTTGFRTFCPTRWTVRSASLRSVLDNYEVFQTF